MQSRLKTFGVAAGWIMATPTSTRSCSSTLLRPLELWRCSLLLVIPILAVICQPSYAANPSILMVSPPFLQSELQSTVVLHCAYNASHAAEVTWTHNNSILASSHFSVFTSEVHTELTLQSLRWKDSGLYACSVYDHQSGNRGTAFTRLSVTEVGSDAHAASAVAGKGQKIVRVPEPDLEVTNPRSRNGLWTNENSGRENGVSAATKHTATGSTAVHKSAWFISVTCIAMTLSMVAIIVLCAARRRRKAQRMMEATEAAKKELDGEEQKALPMTQVDEDSGSKLPIPKEAEIKAKKHGFDYSKPMTVQTMSCSPTSSREASFRVAKSESTITQMLVQKKDSSSPSPDSFKDGKQAEGFPLTASLSDVAALSKDAAQRSKYRIKQTSPDSESGLAPRSASISALQGLPNSSTNLTETPPKQSSRLKLSLGELTKGALRSFKKAPKEQSKQASSEEPLEPVKRPRSKTVAPSIVSRKEKIQEQQILADPSCSPSPKEEKEDSAIIVDEADAEISQIDNGRRRRQLGSMKMSKSLECLDKRDNELPPMRGSGSLTPPPSGCAPLAMLRPKPRPRASTNVARVRKPRVVVEYRAVSPTSWDYSNGTPPALPIIQSAAAGLSTPPSTLSRKRGEVEEGIVPPPDGPPPALPTMIPPPIAEKKPVPLPVPRKSRRNISQNQSNGRDGSIEKTPSFDVDAEKEDCGAYEKVDLTIPPHNPANQGKSTALKTMSAPKPDHIYDRPEGRDQGPVTLRPDVARSYAISGPLDDRAQPPSKAVHAPAKQHRRSTGDIQISELDDILNSLEVSRNDLGKLEEQSNGTVNNTPRFYDRPEHVEKSKGRDRSMSLNQRPTPNVHDPLVQYMSVEFLQKKDNGSASKEDNSKPDGPTVYAKVDPKATNADPLTKVPPRPESPTGDYEPVETPRLVPHSFKAQKPREVFQAQQSLQQQQQTKRPRKQLFQKSLKW